MRGVRVSVAFVAAEDDPTRHLLHIHHRGGHGIRLGIGSGEGLGRGKGSVWRALRSGFGTGIRRGQLDLAL